MGPNILEAAPVNMCARVQQDVVGFICLAAEIKGLVSPLKARVAPKVSVTKLRGLLLFVGRMYRTK
jgi:hypothetical protein